MRLLRIPETSVAVWGGALNAVWEFLQSPLYADWDEGVWHIIWTRLHCTIGDILILLAAFWVTALVFRSRRWITQRGIGACLLFVLPGVAYTAFSEVFNTQIVRNWGYAPAMPTVYGIGLTPLLQWVVVPPLVLWLTCRSLRQSAEDAGRGKGGAAR